MKVFLLSLTCLSFLSFLWSVIGVFKKHPDQDRRKHLMLRIFSVMTWATCLYAFRNDPSELALVIGSSVQAICLIIFWFHAGIVKKEGFTVVYSKDIPPKIVRKGFYRWVRHPFYMTYLISYFSIAAVFGDPLVFVFSGIMALIYFDAAKMEEEKFSLSHLGNEFQIYKKATWMFLPKIHSENVEHNVEKL